MPEHKRGILVAFEGLNGAGKTTQCNLLQESLLGKSHSVISYNFPNLSHISELDMVPLLNQALHSRDLLYSPAGHLLFAVQRANYNTITKENISCGHIVLLDRYVLCSLAYGSARNMDVNWIHNVESGLGNLIPDVTIYLDLQPMDALRRMLKRTDRTDMVVDDLGKVYLAYKSIISNIPGVMSFSAKESADLLSVKITNLVLAIYNAKNGVLSSPFCNVISPT